MRLIGIICLEIDPSSFHAADGISLLVVSSAFWQTISENHGYCRRFSIRISGIKQSYALSIINVIVKQLNLSKCIGNCYTISRL